MIEIRLTEQPTSVSEIFSEHDDKTFNAVEPLIFVTTFGGCAPFVTRKLVILQVDANSLQLKEMRSACEHALVADYSFYL